MVRRVGGDVGGAPVLLVARPMGLALALAALTLVGPTVLGAQAVAVTVLDAVTLQPVTGATVSLLAPAGDPVASGTTDESGVVDLQVPSSGRRLLRVRALGYQSFTSDPIEVGQGEGLELNVRLGVDALPLDPLEVVARRASASPHLDGFERRRGDPTLGGDYLTAEEIRRRPVATPTQLLLAIPSVSIQPVVTRENVFGMDRSLIWFPMSRGRSENPGACLADVYIDGVRTRQSAVASPDDLLEGVALAGVEVYPRPFSAPVEFRGTGECGVVLYWTAEPESSRESWTWKRLAVGGGIVALLVGVALVS